MAFVNDVFRENEIREYKISEYKIIKPGAGTIDREKKLKLLYIGHPRENMVENYFLFVWDDVMIDVTMDKKITGNTVIWKLRGLYIPGESGLDKSEVLEELRNAMRVFGYNGYSIVKFDDVGVEIDF